MVQSAEAVDRRIAFESFVAAHRRRLARGLVAAYGPELGSEACADAVVWAWANWDRLQTMRNPVGYLYRVGQTNAHRYLRVRGRERSGGESIDGAVHDPESDPRLVAALAALSPRQRAAVVLVKGHGYSAPDAAELLGCSVSTLRNHVDRAIRHLRDDLGDHDGD